MWSVGGAFVFGSWFGSWRSERDDRWQREPLLSTAIDSVRANFLDSLPEDVLIRRAVQGMLTELGDPYGALLDGAGRASYRGSLQGESHELGFTLRPRSDGLLVRRVERGSPAAQAGVRPGDVVVTIADAPALASWSAVRERADSALRLGVRRAARVDTLALTIARHAWHRSAVPEALRLDDATGYVRLASLARGAAAELEEAVHALRERGAERLVLDLRGNAGGLYEEGVKAAELFLSRGQLVTSLERRGQRGLDPQIARRSRWPELPLVLVVDRQTASAAELLAAALQDHGRALLVGEATYGKAYVQRIVPLTGDLALRLTTARWLPPGRDPVERREEVNGRVTGGLTPDVYLPAAARLDPASVPASLSPADARRLSEAADDVVARALADGWAGAPAVLLERRARAHLDSILSRDGWSAARRVVLVGDGVRVAVRRLLEVTRGDEALWQYAADDDAALRAARALVAPVRHRGVAPATVDVPAGEAAALSRLSAWTAARFAQRRLDGVPLPDSAGGGAAVAPLTLFIEGRVAMGVDTLVALSLEGASASSGAAWPVAGWRLRDPTGQPTTLPARVIARLPFRAPRVAHADPARASDWYAAVAYAVVVPTTAAHPGGFVGWRLAPEGE